MTLNTKDKELVSKLEQLQLENSNLRNDNDIFQFQYRELFKKYAILNDILSKQKSQIMNNQSMANYTERMLKANTVEKLNLEKKYSKILCNYERLENESKLYKEQASNFKTLFDEMELRKSNEIKCINDNLLSLRINYEKLKKESDNDKDIISSLQLEINQLKKEKEIIKSDNDHLTKIIEDSNLTVKNAEAKSNEIDIVMKNTQKQLNECNLEKEKLNIKIKMLMEQINKMNNDYNDTIKEKNENFDNALTDIKKKCESKINEKIDELNLLKGEKISLKIERDKYLSECNMFNNEIEKLNETIKEISNKNFQEQKEKELNVKRMQGHFQDKIRLINEQNQQLGKENKELKEKLKYYQLQEKDKNDFYNKYQLNNKQTFEEIKKIKDRNELLEKQNDDLSRKNIRLNNKYKELQEQNDFRINVLNSTLKHQDNMYEFEKRFLEKLNQQQDITNNMTNEYLNFKDKQSGKMNIASNFNANVDVENNDINNDNSSNTNTNNKINKTVDININNKNEGSSNKSSDKLDNNNNDNNDINNKYINNDKNFTLGNSNNNNNNFSINLNKSLTNKDNADYNNTINTRYSKMNEEDLKNSGDDKNNNASDGYDDFEY